MKNTFICRLALYMGAILGLICSHPSFSAYEDYSNCMDNTAHDTTNFPKFSPQRNAEYLRCDYLGAQEAAKWGDNRRFTDFLEDMRNGTYGIKPGSPSYKKAMEIINKGRDLSKRFHERLSSKVLRGNGKVEDGFRVRYVQAPEKYGKANVALKIRHLLLEEAVYLDDYSCSAKKNAPKGCLVRIVDSDRTVAEYKVRAAKAGVGTIFYRQPISDSLLKWSNAGFGYWGQLPNLARMDLETLSLSPTSKNKDQIAQLAFWFARSYGMNCADDRGDPTANIGVVAKTMKNGVVIREQQFNNKVDASISRLAKIGHDATVSYQNIQAYGYRRYSNGARDFIDAYGCNSKEVQNVRKSLRYIQASYEGWDGDHVFTNDGELREDFWNSRP